MPTLPQLLLLFAAILAFAVGGGVSVTRALMTQKSDHPMPRLISRVLLILGIVACLGVIAWHSVTRGTWIPVNDNFDALVWLATLLSLFVLYLQRHKKLGSLDWYLMPVVILLLVTAAIFGRADYHEYNPAVRDAWSWVHRVTAYGGAVAFAIAAASGAMYLTASRRLRSKAPVDPRYGSLERLEHLTMTAVTLGFAMLTVAMITGGVQMFAEGKHTSLTKIILAAGVWLIYGIVLHAPINPSFRGRKVAILSVAGFVLMLGTIVAVLVLPAGAT